MMCFAWNIIKQGQSIILFDSLFIFNLNGWIINKGLSLKLTREVNRYH